MLKDIENMDFETALQQLEKIVQQMEAEELSLEKSLQYYQEGIQLLQHCRKLLTDAEFKVEKIANNGESIRFEQDVEEG